MNMRQVKYMTRFGGERCALVMEVTNITELREAINRNNFSYSGEAIQCVGEIINKKSKVFIKSVSTDMRYGIGLWESVIDKETGYEIQEVSDPIPLRPMYVEYGREDDGC